MPRFPALTDESRSEFFALARYLKSSKTSHRRTAKTFRKKSLSCAQQNARNRECYLDKDAGASCSELDCRIQGTSCRWFCVGDSLESCGETHSSSGECMGEQTEAKSWNG